jgi:hypothetical protein
LRHSDSKRLIDGFGRAAQCVSAYRSREGDGKFDAIVTAVTSALSSLRSIAASLDLSIQANQGDSHEQGHVQDPN